MIINTQTILCLDLDTKTGWTISRVDSNITSGTVNFESYRFESNASKGEMINAACAKGHALQDHLENNLWAKANLVRKAVLNTREKNLKEKAMRENSRPLTLVEKQKLEGILMILEEQ
ncbi:MULTISPECIES: hypothetical protein [unclassified Bartonella]|uniref:hypothetical protein n=1 Tax=unclassified Bartonella TaxID=2645622 RepID=UPI0035D0E6BB